MSVYRGVPYTVIYESKNFVQGFANIVAMVRKPNGSMAGPYTLTEMPSPFLGRYSFDFLSSTSDPEGVYTTMIISPTENIQTTMKFELIARATLTINPQDIQDIVDGVVDAIQVKSGTFDAFEMEVDELPVFEVECEAEIEEDIEVDMDLS